MRTSLGEPLSFGVRKWAQGTIEGSFAICSCAKESKGGEV